MGVARNMRPQDHYRQQSSITDPGDHAHLYDPRFEDWRRLYQDERLRIPSVIDSYSPAAAREQMPLRVELALGSPR